MAEAEPGAQSIARSFGYPPDMTEKEKKTFKEDKLVSNPDTLFEDTRRNNSVCNLIFFTSSKEDWRQTILGAFPESKTVRKEDKELIKLSENGATVCIYPSGKFVIQGDIVSLTEFAGRFEDLKKSCNTRVVNRQLQSLTLEDEEETKIPEGK